MSTDAFDSLPLSRALIADLRSDHAGECGAVAIYCGILATTNDVAVRRFARRHLRTELRHRRFFDRWLPRRHQSRLLPLWRAAGWLLGAVSGLFGSRAVFTTVAAVETFVETHYKQQIELLRDEPALGSLAERLQRFCDEEIEHREDAQLSLDSPVGGIARCWASTVGAGSMLGVAIARRI